MVILGTLKILMDPDEQICWNNGNYGNIGNMVFTHFFLMKKAMENIFNTDTPSMVSRKEVQENK